MVKTKLSDENRLSILYPELVKEWHPTKNSKSPSDFTFGSGKKIWWICADNPEHEWEAKIQSRTRGKRCPYCTGKKISDTNSLVELYPEITKEWHPSRNGGKEPHSFSYGSQTKVWWQCTKNPEHEWKAIIASRTKGSGCPYCSGRKVCVDNSLETHYPEIAKEWHSTKNNKTPNEVTHRGSEKVWWRCSENPEHEWEATTGERTNKKHPNVCPHCNSRKGKIRKNLSISNPLLAKEWHPTKNGSLTTEEVSSCTKKKVWWQCRKNPEHQWESKIPSRVKNKKGCPFCLGRLAIPKEIAKEWHPTKNGNLKPEDFRYASHKKVWWLCPKGHDYPTTISHRTVSGTACPYCSNHFVCEDNCLANVKPDLAKEWHPTKNKDLTPFDVTPGMERKVWWQCENNHEWEEKLKHRNRGVCCPECLEEKIKIDNRMIVLFPELEKEWHPTKNGDLKVEEITFGMRRKIWWKCEKGHEYPSKVSSRTKGRSGCPYCAGHKASEENNLGVLFPELINEWHPAKNDCTPFEVLSKSNKIMWWQCQEGHEYPMSIQKKTKGSQCPDCKK